MARPSRVAQSQIARVNDKRVTILRIISQNRESAQCQINRGTQGVPDIVTRHLPLSHTAVVRFMQGK